MNCSGMNNSTTTKACTKEFIFVTEIKLYDHLAEALLQQVKISLKFNVLLFIEPR